MATFSQRINANNNDSSSINSLNFYVNTTIIGYDGSRYQAGLRYTNVTIPKNSTINSATIDVKAQGNSNSRTCVIYAVASDNTAVWDSSNRPDNASRTTASVSWSVPTFSTGTTYTTPDIKSVIQEVVNRAGWSSGNALSVLIITADSNTPAKQITDYNDDPASAAIITIDYTPAASNHFLSTLGAGN